MTGVFVWSILAPAIPVMLIGQVWLYRMTRRSAGAETFLREADSKNSHFTGTRRHMDVSHRE